MPKPIIPFDTWHACDLRVGTVLEVKPAEGLRNKAWVMAIDYGPEIGSLTSVGQFRNYTVEELMGAQVIGVVNLGKKKIGPYTSEALTLGIAVATDPNEGHRRLTVLGGSGNGTAVT